MKTDPNDSAYPIVDQNGYTAGMSKRELLAAMAMQGNLASCAHPKSSIVINYAHIASASVEQADALIAALNEEAK